MGNETWAVYNPRLLDDIPAWVIENIQAVSAYMKTRGHEEWTIAGVRSQSAHAREVEALRRRAEAAEADARRYRWIRSAGEEDAFEVAGRAYNYGEDLVILQGEYLDAAIDAAIASSGEE